ncbi:alpha/beta hydrolase [Microbacterium sp. BK668]|uniref:alpha/beta fold hydrolase n=1 Tax=Microbacterium sp. BK668 TaxID=2512118 RepID=UPI00105B43A6|nr:alpha/beta hydrolase [Microbacterium sp. BK668]TDN87730.1 pimeloyl-ACP methyl ester carboxylesterase [Microbacterium sp. BK668]
MPIVDVGFGPAYYETRGDGEPLLLLHGTAFGFGGGLLAMQVADLAEAGFTVYTPDRVGHGRTPDRDGPYSYEAMADETAAFVDTVIGQPANLVAVSEGVTVGIQVLLRRPDVVKRFVGIGAAFNSAGDPTDAKAGGEAMRANPWPALVESYSALSPDGPDHLSVFLEKLTDMWLRMPEVQLEELSSIRAPVLVMQGDKDDQVRVEHSVAAARALPNGRLAVLPGTHLLWLESPHLLNSIITAFLRDTLAPSNAGSDPDR